MKKLQGNLNDKVDIVILAGGKGSRIKNLINSVPKPLAKIDGSKKFLDYLLNNICKYNINKIFILAGYKGWKIHKAYNKLHIFQNVSRYIVKAKWGGVKKRNHGEVLVHTCSLDHPNALLNYISRGMKVFKKEVIKI